MLTDNLTSLNQYEAICSCGKKYQTIQKTTTHAVEMFQNDFNVIFLDFNTNYKYIPIICSKCCRKLIQATTLLTQYFETTLTVDKILQILPNKLSPNVSTKYLKKSILDLDQFFSHAHLPQSLEMILQQIDLDSTLKKAAIYTLPKDEEYLLTAALLYRRYTLQEIADHLQISKQGVQWRLKKLGIMHTPGKSEILKRKNLAIKLLRTGKYTKSQVCKKANVTHEYLKKITSNLQLSGEKICFAFQKCPNRRHPKYSIAEKMLMKNKKCSKISKKLNIRLGISNIGRFFPIFLSEVQEKC